MGKGALLASCQQAVPEGIIGPANANMIGHDINDQRQTLRLQCFGHGNGIALITKVGVQTVVFGDVMAVGAAMSRGEDGRGIDMGRQTGQCLARVIFRRKKPIYECSKKKIR